MGTRMEAPNVKTATAGTDAATEPASEDSNPNSMVEVDASGSLAGVVATKASVASGDVASNESIATKMAGTKDPDAAKTELAKHNALGQAENVEQEATGESREPIAAAQPAKPEPGAGRNEAKGTTALIRNPHFSAEIRRERVDQEEALTAMAEDIDRARSLGNYDEICTVCEKPGKDFCNGCKLARYCSRECQLVDWSIHKRVCREFAVTTAGSARPSAEHRRILFFPTYRRKPELLWGVHKKNGEQEWIEFEHPDMDEFAVTSGKRDKMAESRGISILNMMGRVGNRPVGRMLCAMHFAMAEPLDMEMDPRQVNLSINGLSKPGYLRAWFGPVAVFVDARHPLERERQVRDMTPRDVHSVVLALQTSDCTCVHDPARFPGETLSGLKVNDVRAHLSAAMGVTALFETARVPLSRYRCPDYPVAMAFHLGLRWYIRPGGFFSRDPGRTVWCDGNLRYLACVADVRETPAPSSLPGTTNNNKNDTTKQEQPAPGVSYDAKFYYGPFFSSAILLHGTGNPIDMHHVLAFNAYLDSVYVRKGVASEAGFRHFWAQYKTALGREVAMVPSPYKWDDDLDDEDNDDGGGGGGDEDGKKDKKKKKKKKKKNKKKAADVETRDRLGVFHWRFVRRIIEQRIDEVWLGIATAMNECRIKDFPN